MRRHPLSYTDCQMFFLVESVVCGDTVTLPLACDRKFPFKVPTERVPTSASVFADWWSFYFQPVFKMFSSFHWKTERIFEQCTYILVHKTCMCCVYLYLYMQGHTTPPQSAKRNAVPVINKTWKVTWRNVKNWWKAVLLGSKVTASCLI